jgi:hypothetical protein
MVTSLCHLLLPPPSLVFTSKHFQTFVRIQTAQIAGSTGAQLTPPNVRPQMFYLASHRSFYVAWTLIYMRFHEHIGSEARAFVCVKTVFYPWYWPSDSTNDVRGINCYYRVIARLSRHNCQVGPLFPATAQLKSRPHAESAFSLLIWFLR